MGCDECCPVSEAGDNNKVPDRKICKVVSKCDGCGLYTRYRDDAGGFICPRCDPVGQARELRIRDQRDADFAAKSKMTSINAALTGELTPQLSTMLRAAQSGRGMPPPSYFRR
jgi:hypothetical protein